MVCLGNICRSPLAKVAFAAEAARKGVEADVDSCGTGHWHVGNGADRRGVACAKRHGLDLRSHRARVLADSDFRDFDRIFAMDRSNLQVLQARCPPAHRHKIALFLDDAEVPDPYYGDDDDFEVVLRLCQDASTSRLTTSLLRR